jgi:hypothetical protein
MDAATAAIALASYNCFDEVLVSKKVYDSLFPVLR